VTATAAAMMTMMIMKVIMTVVVVVMMKIWIVDGWYLLWVTSSDKCYDQLCWIFMLYYTKNVG